MDAFHNFPFGEVLRSLLAKLLGKWGAEKADLCLPLIIFAAYIF
jgi:hypothetical protein